MLTIVPIAIIGLALFPFLAPRLLNLWRPDIIFRIPSQQKTIYLTIDDSPSDATPAILDILKRHKVKATFFIISGQILSPHQITTILAAGHSIGHHMVTDQPGWKLSKEEFIKNFDQCADTLRSYGKIRFFRPPSGYASKAEIAYVRSQGMQPVLGSAYPIDTRIQNIGTLVRLASWLSTNGAILILHDGEARGVRTAQVIDRLIPILKARGYQFGNLRETLPVTDTP